MRAKKHFGQHFLTDEYVLQSILEAINPHSDEHFSELGAGAGALTLPLAKKCAALTCIEIDNAVFPVLQKKVANYKQITLLHADALKTDSSELIKTGGRLVGNLPYNISVLLIEKYLQCDGIVDMHFLVQKEVAHRLFANPGEKEYGRLSLMRYWHATGDILFDVPPHAFSPPPKVTSSFIRLKPHTDFPDCRCNASLQKLVATAFNRPHRTLNNTLKEYAAELKELQLTETRAKNTSAETFFDIWAAHQKNTIQLNKEC